MPEPDVTAELLEARASSPGWGSIFVMRGSQAHDRMHTLELREGLTARGEGGRVLNATDVEMSNSGPFEPYIDMAIAAGAQVIYYHLNGDDYNLAFMQAAERQGYTGKIVTCGMARRPTLLHATDPGIAPYLSAGSATEGRLFFAMRGPVTSPSYDAFKADFLEFSGFQADTFSPAGYDAAVLVGLGLAAAGTSDGMALRQAIAESASAGTKYPYGQLPSALAAARGGGDIDYDGASGSLDFVTDSVLGNVSVGRYYIETVVKPTQAYQFSTLTAPIEIR
jgi:ABC-type branched-subunit amino acid transport system substrate-binding protein